MNFAKKIFKMFFKGLGQNLLWLFDGKWWFRVDAFPCEKMEDRDDIWKNLTSTSVLDEKHKKNWISINIVTSEHDMSYLVRKFRGSEDMPQRTFQNHRSYANQQDSVSKTPNAFGCNLRLPTIHDHFDDGNHQKQVSMLYRILWKGNFQFSEQFLIFCSLRSRSNKDAKDSQADLNFLRRSVEA